MGLGSLTRRSSVSHSPAVQRHTRCSYAKPRSIPAQALSSSLRSHGRAEPPRPPNPARGKAGIRRPAARWDHLRAQTLLRPQTRADFWLACRARNACAVGAQRLRHGAPDMALRTQRPRLGVVVQASRNQPGRPPCQQRSHRGVHSDQNPGVNHPRNRSVEIRATAPLGLPIGPPPVLGRFS